MSPTTQRFSADADARGAPEGCRDAAWLEALFREHHRPIHAYAVRRVGPDAADDIVAEVFTSAWRSRERVPEAARPWLYRTAAHHVLHTQRTAARQGRVTARLSQWGGELDTVADQAADVEDALEVRAMLAQLAPGDAEVLMLHAWEGLSFSEIGYVLSCSAPTARVRLFRARRRARALLAAADAASGPRRSSSLLTKEST